MPFTHCCGSYTREPISLIGDEYRYPHSSCCHAHASPDVPCPVCGQSCEWIIDADIEDEHIDNEWHPIFIRTHESD